MYTNKQIWSVSYPILLSLLAQNVINVTDTTFLGHVSEVALGASAMGGLFYICVFTIAFGFSTGSQIVIARRNGEGRYTDVGPVMIQGVMFLFSMALILFGFTKAFGGNIMRLLVSSESIYEGTMEFLDWRIYGFFFSFVNVMFRALYIGITRTKVLTINAVVMALTNVVLDYALIFGKFGLPEMGIKGAAIASVLAEVSSILFFLIYTYVTIDLKKYGLNRLRSFDPALLMRILSISCFTMLQYFLSMGTWFIFFVAVAGTAGACHRQHRPEYLRCIVDSRQLTGDHHKQPCQQRHRCRRHQACNAAHQQNCKILVLHYVGARSGHSTISTVSSVCLYQRSRAYHRVRPISPRDLHRHAHRVGSQCCVQRHFRHGKYAGRPIARNNNNLHLRFIHHIHRNVAESTDRNLLYN